MDTALAQALDELANDPERCERERVDRDEESFSRENEEKWQTN